MPTAAFTFQGFYRAFRLMLGCGILLQGAAFASGLLNLAEIIAHPDQYDRQEVVVSGQVTNVQLATNRQGQPAYGFLLKDQAGTIKVIGLGQVAVSYTHLRAHETPE